MVAASSRVSANWQMSTSVAWVSAEIGLNERLPHALSQISGLDKNVVQFLDALGLFAVEFADREAVAFDVVDDARRSCCRRGINHAAYDAVRIDILGEDAGGIEALQPAIVVLAAEPLKVPPWQAVLHGQHHGVRSQQ